MRHLRGGIILPKGGNTPSLITRWAIGDWEVESVWDSHPLSNRWYIINFSAWLLLRLLRILRDWCAPWYGPLVARPLDGQTVDLLLLSGNQRCVPWNLSFRCLTAFSKDIPFCKALNQPKLPIVWAEDPERSATGNGWRMSPLSGCLRIAWRAQSFRSVSQD